MCIPVERHSKIDKIINLLQDIHQDIKTQNQMMQVEVEVDQAPRVNELLEAIALVKNALKDHKDIIYPWGDPHILNQYLDQAALNLSRKLSE